MKYISKIFVLILMLFSSLGQVHAEVVGETQKQIQANVERLKTSAQKVVADVDALMSSVSSAIDPSAAASADPNALKQSLAKYKDIVKGIKFEDVAKLDFSSVQESLKKATDEIKAIPGLKQDFASKLDGLNGSVDELIYSAKNIATVIFTAPVQLKGGYGKTGLLISIDTLKYSREDANTGAVAIDVRANFQLPFSVAKDGGSTNIGFVGENVVLAGSGDTKIRLAMEKEGQTERKFPILENKCSMVIDKESYLSIDCNGFKEMRLKGYFEFASNVIFPADTSKKEQTAILSETASSGAEGEATAAPEQSKTTSMKGDTAVRAKFDITIADLEDIVIAVEFDNDFKVKGTGDIVYSVKGVVCDMSTVRNAEDFKFPDGYPMAFPEGDANLWTGFAIKMVKVDASKEIDCLEKFEISAYDMIIDETGFSGWFSAAFEYDGQKKDAAANRVDQSVSRESGPAETKGDKFLKARIDKIAVQIVQNSVKGGELTGNITVPGLKSSANGAELSLDLIGKVYTDSKENFNYDFKARLGNDMKFNLPFEESSTVTIGAGTTAGYSKTLKSKKVGSGETERDSFYYQKGFYFVLNGEATIHAKFINLEGLKFQNLQFSTFPGYFSGGTFSLACAESASLGGLSIGLTHVEAGLQGKLANIGAGIKLGIISDGNGASVGGSFTLESDTEKNWSIVGVTVNSISVDVDFSAFHLNGSIHSYKNDPKYGKGFAGNIELGIDALNINAGVGARFGRYSSPEGTPAKDSVSFKYWYVGATVDLPSATIIFPPAVMLKTVSVAAYSRMKIDYQPGEFKLTDPTKFLPNQNYKFGFIGGIGVYVAQDNLVNASAYLYMDFAETGGISRVGLLGDVYFLSKDKDKSFIKGHLESEYNFELKTFTLGAEVDVDCKGIIKGKGYFNLFTSPKKWYFNLGTYETQCNVKFMDKIKANSYFMLGHDIPKTLPPLDEQITKEFNITQSGATMTDNTDKFESGRGLAFGAKITVDLGPQKFIYANVTLKGGTDALVLKGPNNCGTREVRGSGQTYLYMCLGAGVKPRKKKFCIVELAALALLEAEFPDPYYIAGRVDFKYKVLGGLFKGHAHAKFDIGKHCDASGNYTEGSGLEMDLTDEDGNSLEDIYKDLEDAEEISEEEFQEYMKSIGENPDDDEEQTVGGASQDVGNTGN